MKRRNIIISFLLCACLIVGVGYAALSENLVVNGTLLFDHDGVTGLEEILYFTGNVKVVDVNHNELDTDLRNEIFIIDVQNGQTTASLDAQFTSQNITSLEDGAQYTAGVVFEIKIENPTAESMEVEFTAPTILSEAANQTSTPFVVDSKVKDVDDADVTTLTVDAASEAYVYLHVKMSVAKDQTTGDIELTTFTVTLPVTKIS